MYPVKENSEATQPLEMLLITKEECEDMEEKLKSPILPRLLINRRFRHMWII